MTKIHHHRWGFHFNRPIILIRTFQNPLLLPFFLLTWTLIILPPLLVFFDNTNVPKSLQHPINEGGWEIHTRGCHSVTAICYFCALVRVRLAHDQFTYHRTAICICSVFVARKRHNIRIGSLPKGTRREKQY
jgi:hypothetical protein